MSRKFQKAQKQLRYNIQKLWFKTTFSIKDWESRTGKSILDEARGLDHAIKRADFYKIRRELLEEFGIEANPPDEFEQAHIDYVKSRKENPNKPNDISLDEMIDRQVKILRTDISFKKE